MIEIKKQSVDDFIVTVNKDGQTTHRVKVDNEYYKKLTNKNISKEKLISKSFEFLLERESNQTILKEFNLKVISKYFPEYEEKIKDAGQAPFV